MNPDPRPVCEERLRARRDALAACDRRFDRIAGLRLLAFGALVAAFALAWKGGWPEWTVLVPSAAFVLLVLAHDRVARARERARRAADHFERALRRIDDDWRRDGAGRADLVPADHPLDRKSVV